MRYVTGTASWEGGTVHPLSGAFAAESDVRIEKIYYSNRVGTDTYADLCRYRGDLDRARAVLRSVDEVLHFELPPGSDGIAYVYFEGSPLFDQLLSVLFEHAVAMRWPVTFLESGDDVRARMTMFGTERTIANALDAVPAEVTFSLERTGEFSGSFADPTAALTDRQREVLDVALASGYYEVPREVTQADLSEQLDLAPSTVADHLRRIESNLVSALA